MLTDPTAADSPEVRDTLMAVYKKSVSRLPTKIAPVSFNPEQPSVNGEAKTAQFGVHLACTINNKESQEGGKS